MCSVITRRSRDRWNFRKTTQNRFVKLKKKKKKNWISTNFGFDWIFVFKKKSWLSRRETDVVQRAGVELVATVQGIKLHYFGNFERKNKSFVYALRDWKLLHLHVFFFFCGLSEWSISELEINFKPLRGKTSKFYSTHFSFKSILLNFRIFFIYILIKNL